MAAELVVPAAYRKVLTGLARLEVAEATALIDSIAAVPPLARVMDIQDAAKSAVNTPEHEVIADRLVGSLLSLLGRMRGHSVADLADALSRSSDLDLKPEERERLRDRVAKLAATDAISSTAVGVDLLTQHARNFSGARIFTDIRPLFEDDVDAEPTNAVIVETLQIEVWSRDGDRETLHVAMDETDLTELRGVVDRALKKTAAVKRMLDKQGIRTFDLDEEPA